MAMLEVEMLSLIERKNREEQVKHMKKSIIFFDKHMKPKVCILCV